MLTIIIPSYKKLFLAFPAMHQVTRVANSVLSYFQTSFSLRCSSMLNASSSKRKAWQRSPTQGYVRNDAIYANICSSLSLSRSLSVATWLMIVCILYPTESPPFSTQSGGAMSNLKITQPDPTRPNHREDPCPTTIYPAGNVESHKSLQNLQSSIGISRTSQSNSQQVCHRISQDNPWAHATAYTSPNRLKSRSSLCKSRVTPNETVPTIWG